MTVFDKLCTAE